MGWYFFLPLIQIKIVWLYGVDSKCYWQNFRVYSEIWVLKSTCKVKMDMVQNYQWKLIILLPYSVSCHLFPAGPEQPVWPEAYCWVLDEIVLACIDAMETGVSILHRSPRWGHEPLPRWLEEEKLSLWLAQEAGITGLYHKMLKRKWQFSIKIPSDSFQFLP